MADLQDTLDSPEFQKSLHILQLCAEVDRLRAREKRAIELLRKVIDPQYCGDSDIKDARAFILSYYKERA